MTIIKIDYVGLIGSITFILIRFLVRERQKSGLELPKR